jgi:hypothetical protein
MHHRQPGAAVACGAALFALPALAALARATLLEHEKWSGASNPADPQIEDCGTFQLRYRGSCPECALLVVLLLEQPGAAGQVLDVRPAGRDDGGVAWLERRGLVLPGSSGPRRVPPWGLGHGANPAGDPDAAGVAEADAEVPEVVGLGRSRRTQ